MIRWIILLYILVPASLLAQSGAPYAVQRVKGPIVLDGLSNEPAWEEIEALPLAMHSPVYGGQSTERTEIRIAYDNERIYVSGRLYDSEPAAIQANSVIRDIDAGGDFMNVLFDTFNDNQNIVAFMTTPSGNRIDSEVFNDAEGEAPYSFSWNSYWDCAVVRNDQGWFAEMEIPFSSLRFQDDNGRVVFGFIAHRLIARRNERLTFPAIEPKKVFSPWKASNAHKIVFEGIYRANPVYVSPYFLVGNDHVARPLTGSSGYDVERKFSREIGLDVKYGFAQNMTLDLTVNTDFAQAEADDQQINLTRFSLFYPERRQFFQERAGVFEFRYGSVNRLFHSRRIGLTDDGEPVRIIGGARLIGKTGDWDLGLIDMQTGHHGALPPENVNVIRVRRNVLNQDSYIGLMETGRFSTGSSPGYNVAVGLDGIFRVSASDYLQVNAIRGVQDGVRNSFADQSVFSVDVQRRTSEGLGGNLAAMYIGDQYDPGLGYNRRRGGMELSGTVLYGWFENENTIVRKHTPEVSWSAFLRNADGTEESGILTGRWTIDLKSGAIALFEVSTIHEILSDTLAFADHAKVWPGNYSFLNLKTSYTMSPGDLLRAIFTLEGGTFYDGRRVTASVLPTWNVSRYCEIGLEFQYNRVQFPGRSELLNASLARLRVRGGVNENLSFAVLSQYGTVSDIFENSLRLRYNFREGIDAYLVFNTAKWVRREFNELGLSALNTSNLMLKYVHTLSPGGSW